MERIFTLLDEQREKSFTYLNRELAVCIVTKSGCNGLLYEGMSVAC